MTQLIWDNSYLLRTDYEDEITSLRKEYKTHNKNPKNWERYLYTQSSVLDRLITIIPGCAIVFKKFNWNNILLAGGSVASILSNKEWTDTDLDFYIYGLTEEHAMARLTTFIGDILSDVGGRWHIIRSSFAITLFSLDYTIPKIQICFNLVRDPLELLLTFDLSVSMACLNDKLTYCTYAAHEAYTTNEIILTSRLLGMANPQLIKRLYKYTKRGFTMNTEDSEMNKVIEKVENYEPKKDNRPNMYYSPIEHIEMIKSADRECIIHFRYIPKQEGYSKVESARGDDVYVLPTVWDMLYDTHLWVLLNTRNCPFQHSEEVGGTYCGYSVDVKIPLRLPRFIEFYNIDQLDKLREKFAGDI